MQGGVESMEGSYKSQNKFDVQARISRSGYEDSTTVQGLHRIVCTTTAAMRGTGLKCLKSTKDGACVDGRNKLTYLHMRLLEASS